MTRTARVLLPSVVVLAALGSPIEAHCQSSTVQLLDNLVVELEDGVTPGQLASSLEQEGVTVRNRIRTSNTWILDVPESVRGVENRQGFRQLASRIRNISGVRAVDRDFIATAIPHSDPNDEYFLPDEPEFSDGQWALRDDYEYSSDVEIAWQRATGEGRYIAIIDNDFEFGHEDLYGQVVRYADYVNHPDYDYEDPIQSWINESNTQRWVLYPTGDWKTHDGYLDRESEHGTQTASEVLSSLVF